MPLVKDRNGPADKVSNYRGITLSPVISKIFEVCLSEKFSHFLSSHRLQFGFKKGSGCSSAIFLSSKSYNILLSATVMFTCHHWMLLKHLIMWITLF